MCLGLPVNIRLRWKRLTVTNALAYHDVKSNTTIKEALALITY